MTFRFPIAFFILFFLVSFYHSLGGWDVKDENSDVEKVGYSSQMDDYVLHVTYLDFLK